MRLPRRRTRRDDEMMRDEQAGRLSPAEQRIAETMHRRDSSGKLRPRKRGARKERR